MVREFVAFSNKYGLKYVPKAMRSKYPKLANWINKTRFKLSRLDREAGKVYGMTEQKLLVLREIWFEKALLRRDSWERNFASLCLYKAKRRNCNVHTKDKKFEKLGHWVRYVGVGVGWWSVVEVCMVSECAYACWSVCLTRVHVERTSHQRTYYKRFLAGKKSPLTQKRIDRLDGVGFVWQKIQSPKAPKRSPARRR
jgi:hypothetical protein